MRDASFPLDQTGPPHCSASSLPSRRPSHPAPCQCQDGKVPHGRTSVPPVSKSRQKLPPSFYALFFGMPLMVHLANNLGNVIFLRSLRQKTCNSDGKCMLSFWFGANSCFVLALLMPPSDCPTVEDLAVFSLERLFFNFVQEQLSECVAISACASLAVLTEMSQFVGLRIRALELWSETHL